jgi:hypothetical protein
MINGKESGCSEYHCGVWELTPQQAHGLMAFWAFFTFHTALQPDIFAEEIGSWGPMWNFPELMRPFMDYRPEW